MSKSDFNFYNHKISLQTQTTFYIRHFNFIYEHNISNITVQKKAGMHFCKSLQYIYKTHIICQDCAHTASPNAFNSNSELWGSDCESV